MSEPSQNEVHPTIESLLFLTSIINYWCMLSLHPSTALQDKRPWIRVNCMLIKHPPPQQTASSARQLRKLTILTGLVTKNTEKYLGNSNVDDHTGAMNAVRRTKIRTLRRQITLRDRSRSFEPKTGNNSSVFEYNCFGFFVRYDIGQENFRKQEICQR
jgi:hypothetical protein